MEVERLLTIEVPSTDGGKAARCDVALGQRRASDGAVGIAPWTDTDRGNADRAARSVLEAQHEELQVFEQGPLRSYRVPGRADDGWKTLPKPVTHR